MVNAHNLKPPRSSEEARSRGRAGGKASGRARRRQKEFRKVLEALLVLDAPDLDGMSNLEGICVSLVKKAQAGDVGAATWVRDTVGQKPTDKAEQMLLGAGSIEVKWKDKADDQEEAARGFLRALPEAAPAIEEVNTVDAVASMPEAAKRSSISSISSISRGADMLPEQAGSGRQGEDPYAVQWVAGGRSEAQQPPKARRTVADIFE